MTVENEVDRYLDNLDSHLRAALSMLRALIQEAVPEAAESMKYRMQAYEFKGNLLCGFVSRKQHMGLCIHAKPFEKYGDRLE